MNDEEAILRASWSGDLETHKGLFAGVRKANQLLEQELGRSTAFVTAEWKLVRDRMDRILVELTLTDVFTQSKAAERFAPDEFANEGHLAGRLHRLWGVLLQARSDGQIRRLEELVRQEEG
jgi:hypothetical protein